MNKSYTVKLDGKDVFVTSDELKQLASFCNFDAELQSRISHLFWLDLYVYFNEFGINPLMIAEEIINLENGDGNTSTKPATEFHRKPLKGLWHKHFFCQHFIAQNILIALGKKGTEKIIREVMDESGNTHFTEKDMSEIAKRITNDPLSQRATSKRVTGEWIMFAKDGGKNYYLSLNTHAAGDQFIADRISVNCEAEFPFIKNILEAEIA